ncbi:MAG: hypothetical protein WCG75_09185, partial [Armatimonadota bacterium]
VYYPPPPGQPLISFEAKERARQFVYATVLLGVIAAILIFAFTALTNSIQSSKTSKTESKDPVVAGTKIPNTGVPVPTLENTKSYRREGSTAANVNAPVVSKPSGPTGDQLVAQADNSAATITDVAKVSTLIAAGDAYHEAGENEKAYDAYRKAYKVRVDNSGSKRDLRDLLYKMQEVTEEGSAERAAVDQDLAVLGL